ncbi:MAG: hypothetical protein OEY64_10605 [Nitrospinota bacterium]|nr:hypothetical protein [Nitrospinota bacterium]
MGTVEEINDSIKDDIDKVTELFKEYQKDGFSLNEIAKFTFEAGTILVEAVEEIDGITGKQKKEAVKNAVVKAYKTVDPNIPWIPEPFETLLEDMLLDKTLDAFIDSIVKNYREKGVFQRSN